MFKIKGNQLSQINTHVFVQQLYDESMNQQNIDTPDDMTDDEDNGKWEPQGIFERKRFIVILLK